MSERNSDKRIAYGYLNPASKDINKHRDSKLRFSELLPVSVEFQTSHTALEADCPGNSGTKQEVPFTKSTLESHSLDRAVA